MNFQILLFVSCVLSVLPNKTIAGDAPDMVKKVFQNCLTETGATEVEMDHIIKHDPTTTHEGKCLRACIMKQLQTITTDGKFSAPHILKISELYTKGDEAKVKIAKEMIAACENVPITDDLCQTAEDYSACIRNEGKSRGASFDL